MTARTWTGVVIAEGLSEPTLINDFAVYRAAISKSELPIDEGHAGRWHLYWVRVSEPEIDKVQAATRHEWYAHFWQDDRMIVCYDDARFEVSRYDRSTWQAAIDHGLEQGLRAEWLDFPTDDSLGELEDQA